MNYHQEQQQHHHHHQWRNTACVLFLLLRNALTQGCLESHLCEHCPSANKNRITQADWCDMYVYIYYVVVIVFFHLTSTTSTGHCSYYIHRHTLLSPLSPLWIEFLSNTNTREKKETEERNFSFSPYFLRRLSLIYVFVRWRRSLLADVSVIWVIICPDSVVIFIWARRTGAVKKTRENDSRERCLDFLGQENINCYHRRKSGRYEKV